MLRRVRITGYKSLADVQVETKPLTVLFGPNSAGKSNFLDALQLLSRITTSKSLKSAFDPPYRGKPLESFTFGPSGVADLIARDSASFALEVDVELSQALIDRVNRQITEMRRPTDEAEQAISQPASATVRERHLRYRIEIQVIPRSGIIRVIDEKLAALTSLGDESKARKPFLERVKHRLHLRMEHQAHPTYYDQYLDHSVLSTNLYAPHYPHMVAMREELSEWFFFYLEPRERMRSPNPVKEATSIGVMGEDLASYLNTLQATNEPQFRSFKMALHAMIPTIEDIRVEVNLKGEAEIRVTESGRDVPASVISEGTLRIMGLLAMNSARALPSVIGFEEPENGIHPARITLIAKLLSGVSDNASTTLIITTHSPLLLDLLPSGSLYAVTKEGGNTTVKPFTARMGELSKKSDIELGLDDVPALPVSQLVRRGDFDAA
ncbi:MAG: AAA family ATPase [Vulcanimicrobiaceae bacterium]